VIVMPANVLLPREYDEMRFAILSKSNDTSRIRPLTATLQCINGPYTAVISGAKIRPYHNEITAPVLPCTVKIRPRIRCPRLRENTISLRCRMKQIYGEITAKIRIAVLIDLGHSQKIGI
jgi:hypothetical protein